MNAHRKIIFFVTLLLFALVSGITQQGHIVALAPFELVGGFAQGDADVILELFTAELQKNSGIRVIDRSSFDQAVSRLRFQASDWQDTNRIAELGRALGAHSVIRGQLMTLAGNLIISARIINVSSASLISEAPLQLSNLGELIGALPAYVGRVLRYLSGSQAGSGSGLRIGDRGPGGGIIFFAEDGQFMECSESLGRVNWREALTMASEFDGNGLNDWSLPSRAQLDLIYQNLHRNNIGDFSGDWHWSSTENNRENSWAQRFSDGRRGFNPKTSRGTVVAVRTF